MRKAWQLKDIVDTRFERLAEDTLESIVSLREEKLLWAMSFTRLSTVTNLD